jgi:hypothetical protein
MKNFRDCEAVKAQDQGRDCPVWCGWGACCFWGFPCSSVCGCPCDRLACATQNLEVSGCSYDIGMSRCPDDSTLNLQLGGQSVSLSYQSH